MSVTIYTVGHSNIEPKIFIEHLKQYNIDLLVDVRSKPYSQYASSFNKDDIERLCKANQINYVFMGNSLGGKPDDVSVYPERPSLGDKQGERVVRDGNKAAYHVLSEKSYFLEGIDKLIQQTRNKTVCIMCSEGQPYECHRNLLITPALEGKGIEVLHILPDGTVINSEQLKLKKNQGQKSLF